MAFENAFTWDGNEAKTRLLGKDSPLRLVNYELVTVKEHAQAPVTGTAQTAARGPSRPLSVHLTLQHTYVSSDNHLQCTEVWQTLAHTR